MASQEAEAKEQDECRTMIEWEDVSPDQEQRAWVRACLAAINTHPAPGSYSERVQLARDKATVAACERMARIFHSDLEPIE